MSRADLWTPEEEAWLRESYPTNSNAALAEMHAELFPDAPERTVKAIGSRAKIRRLRKADGFQRNPPTFWTPEKDAWFRAFVPGHTEAEISAEHERLYGTPLTEAQIGNSKTRLGVKSGTHGGRFVKGQEPPNKGKTWDEFMPPESQERSRLTCFKPGEVHGAALARMQPIGSERVNNDGYVEVKVAEGLQSKPNSNFRMKHHIAWEEANGKPVPPHTMIVFADHDKLNFAPENLVAVPRDLWAVISHRKLDYWDAESLGVCMNIARVNRARHAAQCRPRPCKSCGEVFEARYANQRTCDKCLGR